MSFSPDWLALREGADHAARAPAVAQKVFAHFAAHEQVTIVDFGCGTGSNLRAMAQHLPTRQTWRLVDWDENLLAAARTRLIAWADRTKEAQGVLTLIKGGCEIVLELRQADLAKNFESVLDGADLLTATAFFDLVSGGWMDALSAALARRRLPLYAILTYDGREDWQPAHAADAAVLAAFHAHQKSDKGFGVAAGPDAAAYLAQTLAHHGFVLTQGESPWRLSSGELLRQLAQGAASAVAETGLVGAQDVAVWREARVQAASCSIGHIDLFAVPR